MKYIDAEDLTAEIRKLRSESCISESDDYYEYAKSEIIDIIDSLQQDKETLMLEMCNQSFWEDSGYIMIPPDVTIEGIESLLKQVKKKLQQEQPEVDLEKERKNLSHTMLPYAADVFSGKMRVEDISYSYRQKLADYFRDLAKTAQEK